MHVDSFIVGFFLYTSLRMFILSLQLYQFKHVSNTITWNDKHLYSNTLSYIYRTEQNKFYFKRVHST